MPEEASQSPQVVLDHWEKCESLGLPSTFHLSDDGQYRIVRMPLHESAESFTMSGKVASEKGMTTAENVELGTLLLFHYPNTWNHFLSDHSVTFRVTPLSANRTMVTTKWLVHKDAIEGKDYELDDLLQVWKATNEQDKKLVEENHRGIESLSYKPGPYSTLHEGGVIQFVDWYRRTTTNMLNGAVDDYNNIEMPALQNIDTRNEKAEVSTNTQNRLSAFGCSAF